MTDNNQRFPFNDIHPTAIIYPGVQIGNGNRIGPYCIIGAPPEWKGREGVSGRVVIGNANTITGHVTIDSGADHFTRIGNDCYFMKHSHGGHDCIIGNNVTVSCGAKIGGHAELEDGVNVGLNATIIQKKLIPRGVMIGMNAVITSKLSMEPFKVYAGNPAVLIAENTRHPQYPTYTIDLKDGL